jgi:hypothetical protein
MSDAQHTRNTFFSREDDASPGTYNVVAGVMTISGPDGSAKVLDATTLSSTVTEQIMGLPNNGNFQIGLFQNEINTEQDKLEADRVAAKTHNYQIQYADPNDFTVPRRTRTFSGNVLTYNRDSQQDETYKATLTILIRGTITDVKL